MNYRAVGIFFLAVISLVVALVSIRRAWNPSVEPVAEQPAVAVPWVAGAAESGLGADAKLPPQQLRAKASDVHATAEARAQAIYLIAKANDWDSTGVLIDLLDDASPLVRGRAASAVRQILGTDFYYQANDDRPRRLEAASGIRRYWQSRAKRPNETDKQPDST